MNTTLSVMVGLVPTIHAFAGREPFKYADARHKGEHDELEQRRGMASGTPLR